MNTKPKRRCPHTMFRRGKRVRVVLRNGEAFFAKFLDRSRVRVHFLDHDPVATKDLSSVTIAR